MRSPQPDDEEMIHLRRHMFNPDNALRSEATQRLYACYAVAYTVVDVLAAVLFIVGSILFFRESTTTTGTWLFLIGSILFGVRPCISLVREWHLLRIRDYDDLAAEA
ncbi:YrhK family protein [Corynebacterium sp. P7003]|uniref:YrhK family protein n=1 Tax=Corynebacterium pygosceleis TaxID=2800406 RepID=A0ABT3WUA1_9CORY|nr:YrhK family protein [Corynebacterium pygosceleis]MCX7444785.1 YrhK family protein [Corynebacterium pygosceleis]